MKTDRIVFLAVVGMVAAYGLVMWGYRMGAADVRKTCPPAPAKMVEQGQ